MSRYKIETRMVPRNYFRQQQYSYVIVDTKTGRDVNATSDWDRANWLLDMRNGKENGEEKADSGVHK